MKASLIFVNGENVEVHVRVYGDDGNSDIYQVHLVGREKLPKSSDSGTKYTAIPKEVFLAIADELLSNPKPYVDGIEHLRNNPV